VAADRAVKTARMEQGYVRPRLRQTVAEAGSVLSVVVAGGKERSLNPPTVTAIRVSDCRWGAGERSVVGMEPTWR